MSDFFTGEQKLLSIKFKKSAVNKNKREQLLNLNDNLSLVHVFKLESRLKQVLEK